MNKVIFLGEACSVKLGKYPNGRTAIELICEDGSPMATATINIPEIVLEPNEVILKTYSENEGMLEALREAGIVGAVIDSVQLSFNTVPIVEFLGA